MLPKLRVVVMPSRSPLADRGRHRGATQSDHRHQRDVARGIEVGMVEQAGEKDRRTLAGRATLLEHRLQHAPGSHTSIRWMGLRPCTGSNKAASIPMP